MPLSLKRNFNAQRSKRSLSTAEPPSKRSGGFRPPFASSRCVITETVGANAQKVRGVPGRGGPHRHDVPDTGRYWVGLDHVFGGGLLICVVGTKECAGGP